MRTAAKKLGSQSRHELGKLGSQSGQLKSSFLLVSRPEFWSQPNQNWYGGMFFGVLQMGFNGSISCIFDHLGQFLTKYSKVESKIKVLQNENPLNPICKIQKNPSITI